MGNATTLFVDPLTLHEMFERENLPKGTIFREDNLHWGLWVKSTNLPAVEGANLYPAAILNNGNEVRVIVNGYDLGAIEPRALPEAVEALRAYGGKKAPAYVRANNGRSKTDSVYVIKPPKFRVE